MYSRERERERVNLAREFKETDFHYFEQAPEALKVRITALTVPEAAKVFHHLLDLYPDTTIMQSMGKDVAFLGAIKPKDQAAFVELLPHLSCKEMASSVFDRLNHNAEELKITSRFSPVVFSKEKLSLSKEALDLPIYKNSQASLLPKDVLIDLLAKGVAFDIRHNLVLTLRTKGQCFFQIEAFNNVYCGSGTYLERFGFISFAVGNNYAHTCEPITFLTSAMGHPINHS